MLRNNQGFTFIEIMIVSAVFAILIGTTVPVYLFFQSEERLTVAKFELIQQIRLAQKQSAATFLDSTYGVYMTGTQYTYYRGDSYATRIEDNDQILTLPDGVQFMGSYEVAFQEKSGDATGDSTIELEDVNTSDQVSVLINSEGLVY